ncbi:aldo/keto reductase [Phenylobacterium sp.]|uniref:aldo/keto reductase n=1 Tax=Phenylobacterium sp. TaxID=1871053 RepID=UPI002ED7B09F
MTPLPFTRLGFGGAPLGNLGEVLDEARAEAVVEAAWDTGLRYFDTAPLYGHGLSEMRLGRILAGKRRGDFLISTKVGRLLEPCAPGEEGAGVYLQTPHVRGVFDYSYDGVMRSFEESLNRLGLDRIDILFVHDTDARNHGGWAACEARLAELMDLGGWRALRELRGSGAVSAIGMGVNEWEPCAWLLERADPDLFLLAGRYTLLEQGPLGRFLPACGKRGVGIVLGGPYNSGILARGPQAGASFDYAAAPPEVIARVRRIEAVCRRFGTPLAAAALQFAGAHPAVVTVIPGAMSADEVRANVAAQALAIPPGLWNALRAEGLLHPAAPVPAPAPC